MFTALPSLKNLCQRELKRAASAAPSTFVRCVHQTSKKETILSNLASDSKSRYASMNLQGLKMECKRRGLKVSGKKIDLVQRLSNSSGNGSAAKDSRNFSTTNTKRPQKNNKKGSKHQENVTAVKQFSTSKVEQAPFKSVVPKKEEIKKPVARQFSTTKVDEAPITVKTEISSINGNARQFSTTKIDEAPVKAAIKKEIINTRPFSTSKVEQAPIKVIEPITKESTRSISSTAPVKAKGDSSHIDFFKFPPTPHFENKIEHIQVPSLSSKASSKGFSTAPTEVNASNPAVSLGVETTTPVNIGGEILINKHDEKVQEDYTPSNVTYYGDKSGLSPHEYHSSSKNSLDGNDKLFFTGFALLTLGWWSLKEDDRN